MGCPYDEPQTKLQLFTTENIPFPSLTSPQRKRRHCVIHIFPAITGQIAILFLYSVLHIDQMYVLEVSTSPMTRPPHPKEKSNII